MTTKYEEVTGRILSMLERGVPPWRRPWTGGPSFPTSWTTGKSYRGINTWLLEPGEYLTFNAARAAGGHVKKGEKGTSIIFWKFLPPREGEDNGFAMLKSYTVFEVGQCEGIPRRHHDEKTIDFSPIAEAERIVSLYKNPPSIRHQGTVACYRPSEDSVTLPPKETFHSEAEYYSTLFHELGHSTGNASRLKRPSVTGGYDHSAYGKEELVAELCSSMLCSMCRIDNSVIDNAVAYIQHWKRAIEGDSHLIILASAQAQKASDYILGINASSASDDESVPLPLGASSEGAA